MKSLGEAAMDLLWLSPCARSLLALARVPIVRAWAHLRTDPGLVLLAAGLYMSMSKKPVVQNA